MVSGMLIDVWTQKSSFMNSQYPRFTIQVVLTLFISIVLIASCKHDQSVQEFSRQQDPVSTSLATPASDDMRALAVAAPVTYNIFSSPTVSSNLGNDGKAIELGVKFRVTQTGYITGVRFYKKAGNTGTHIGHLWSSIGTKLAEATFTSETSSGWQQVLFTTPVAVITGKTYVASYFSSAGYYNVTRPSFTSAVVSGPLRALANGEDGSNGVFKYSTTSVFPNSGSNSSNYWVDVIFSTDTTQPPVTPPPPPPATGYFSLPLGTSQIYNNRTNLVIENLRFTNPSGTILKLNGCSNVIIRNCYFGASLGEAVSIEHGSNITIEKCLFANNRTMVYINRASGNVKVLNNQFVNCKGPMPRGQFVQFNTCTGPGYLVQGNRGECFDGSANPEEMINIFSSTGTPESPLTVKDNILRGGGPSNSGGGIAIGDYGGAWIRVENNKLVNPGQQGIGVGGGHDIVVTGNQVFSVQKPWSNIGMFIWAQAGAACNNISLTNNRVSFTNKNGVINNWWYGGGCTNANYVRPTSITLAEMNVPAHLIDFITPAQLLTIK
jgi:hypothetical protein